MHNPLIRSGLTRTALLAIPVAFLIAFVFYGSPANAAFSFQFVQSGSVAPGPAPVYTLNSIVPYYDLGVPYTATNEQFCAAAAQNQGFSDSSDYTCDINTYTNTFYGIGNFPPGPGGYGDPNQGGGGNGAPGAPGGTTMPGFNLRLYSGSGLSLQSACPVVNGADQYGNTTTGSTCNTYVHNGAQLTVPSATLSATPSSITQGGSSALTYSCSNAATSASINNGVGAVSPASAGTVSVSPNTTTTYTVTCTNAAGSGTDTSTVTVTPVPTFPDLTASNISPSSAVAGTPVTLSATITNGGTASTGTGFTNLFQRATDANGSNATDIGTDANGALANGGSSSATLAYTFPSAGTFYVRACADKSSAADAVGVINESDEFNNCSPSWTAVTVSAAPVPPPPTLSCSVNNTAPTVGQVVTYTATGASAPFTWTSSDGGIYGTGATASRSFPATGSYGMTVSKPGYVDATCPFVSVGGVGFSCSNPTGTLTAAPNRIKPGGSSVLTYSASGITGSCSVTGPGVASTIPANTCTVPNTTVSTGALTTQAVYILTCDGTERARTVVNVVPNIIEF